jgi:hypothetical protein
VVSVSGEIVCPPITVDREMGSPPGRDYDENMQLIIAARRWNGAPGAMDMFPRASIRYRPRNDQAGRAKDCGFPVHVVTS